LLIVGVDPGTATTGYGVVARRNYDLILHDYGVVRTESSLEPEVRLHQIHQQIMQQMSRYDADAVAVEKLFFNKNVRTAMTVGQARGVVMLAAAERDLTVLQYTPSQVKSAVTGHGAASKRQVQMMVRSLLAMDELPRPDDAADALAVAICGLQNWSWQKKVEAQK